MQELWRLTSWGKRHRIKYRDNGQRDTYVSLRAFLSGKLESNSRKCKLRLNDWEFPRVNKEFQINVKSLDPSSNINPPNSGIGEVPTQVQYIRTRVKYLDAYLELG